MKSGKGYQHQSNIFRALSHPVRLQILDILKHQEACVCHLTAVIGRPQPYVSQQLGTLRDAGLVADRREGTLIYYRLADDRIAEMLDESKEFLTTVLRLDVSFPPAPSGQVNSCPCPRCNE